MLTLVPRAFVGQTVAFWGPLTLLIKLYGVFSFPLSATWPLYS